MTDDNKLLNKIFSVDSNSLGEVCEEVFRFQYENNVVYKQWCNLVNVASDGGNSFQDINELINKIPFLPISFFKSHEIKTTSFEPEQIFESSGTTKQNTSKHLVKDISVYEESFLKAFKLFYGDIEKYCVLALLPSYLERTGSSLVMMADKLIKLSSHAKSGFYLDDFDALHNTLIEQELNNQPTLLLGVTFGLLDFSEQYQLNLKHTIIMETGGMKGRKKEMTRMEVHEQLKKGFGVENIHSEYGMTELLSQGYSFGKGIFNCPPWMKICVRSEDDPLTVSTHGKGIINVIDLANIYSSSFIATEDIGIIYEDGSFEVLGRLDNSDIRGCSLMYQ